MNRTCESCGEEREDEDIDSCGGCGEYICYDCEDDHVCPEDKE